MSYPDIKFIVSGYFSPLDASRCCVCGADLAAAGSAESTCSNGCRIRMCRIQRNWTEDDCQMAIDIAREQNDPRLIG